MNVLDIPIDKLEKNAWNPNAMGEKAFERLVKEIEDVGFIAPIQVVPLDDGQYRILGGEHRVEAAKRVGMDTVPGVVLDEAKWKDEDLQKFVTVRLNVIRGKLDPGRMVALYDEMAKKYGDDALQEMFAYTDTREWDRMLSSIKRGLKEAGVSKEDLDRVDRELKEKRSVENLGIILNELFAKYGDTVDQDFLIFTYKKAEHVYVAMDHPTKQALKKIANYCRDSGESMAELLKPALLGVAAELKPSKKKKRKPVPVRTDPVDF